MNEAAKTESIFQVRDGELIKGTILFLGCIMAFLLDKCKVCEPLEAYGSMGFLAIGAICYLRLRRNGPS
jgi:hypothetical protein